ncbi:hypothetical protein ACQKNX_24520 [Lysinibacillus sp. NPDC093712]
MTQLSVKGLTVCTPEFHARARRGEQTYKLAELERKAKKAEKKLEKVGG